MAVDGGQLASGVMEDEFLQGGAIGDLWVEQWPWSRYPVVLWVRSIVASLEPQYPYLSLTFLGRC